MFILPLFNCKKENVIFQIFSKFSIHSYNHNKGSESNLHVHFCPIVSLRQFINLHTVQFKQILSINLQKSFLSLCYSFLYHVKTFGLYETAKPNKPLSFLHAKQMLYLNHYSNMALFGQKLVTIFFDVPYQILRIYHLQTNILHCELIEYITYIFGTYIWCFCNGYLPYVSTNVQYRGYAS